MNLTEDTYTTDTATIHYYEIKNDLKPLVMIHAQGVCALSYDNLFRQLAKRYHVYAVDCYGHGKSTHDPEIYRLPVIGDDLIQFISNVIKRDVVLTGHSSGGLIAAYIAAHADFCRKLFLEDPPLFSSKGDRRFKTYNYLDLSTICHQFIGQKAETDFVLYYFEHQKSWDFFPDRSREKIRRKMIAMAKKFRQNHPDKDLKLPFWPKTALSGFRGMQDYDPYFGEAFYTDLFHAGISHEEMLKRIACPTVIMKAQTNFDRDGVLLAAMCEEDAEKANVLIRDSKLMHFNCGHGIHVEQKAEFLQCLLTQ